MLVNRHWLLPAFTIFIHFLPVAQAIVTLHYFAHTSCNAGTALSEYTSPAPASADGSCHYAPDGTAALYIDGIDAGCTVRTYSDTSCSSVIGLSITVGTCYYPSDGYIASYKFVCGSGLGSGPAASDAANTTMSITSMSGSETAPTFMETIGTASTSTTIITQSPVSGTTSLSSDHTAVTANTPTPATTHTCSGNCTWTNHPGPTSKQPGLQTGGFGTGANGAIEAKDLSGWRKHVLKGLMAMGAAEALWGFI